MVQFAERVRCAMNQTPVFRNINIFFSYSNVWFLHLHSTKNYTQTCRPAVHNCYDWGRPVVAGGDAGAGKGWIARNSFSFFSFSLSLLGEWIYTHLAGGRRSVHCFRYRPFHSAPNTRPLVLSFCRIFTGSSPCTRTHDQLHPFYFLSFFLIHAHSSSLISSSTRYLFRYFFSFFFFSLLVIYTRARVHVCRVLIFSNI